MCKISVIIPIYNSEEYLEECLDSVKFQTLEDIEIICINDGSTDNSLNILERYSKSDQRFKIINKANGGQSSARNKGLEIAKGEYIAFLDSDDSMKPNMLKTLYNLAKNKDTDITICSISLNNENTSETTEHDPYFSLDIFPKEMDSTVFDFYKVKDFLFRICVTPWNKIYKKAFLKENNIKFIEGLNFEDLLFFIETFTSAKKINYTKSALINYRYFSKISYSTNSGEKDYKKLDFFKIFKLEEKYLKKKNLYKLLSEGFKFNKKNSLFHWYDKITDKKIKLKFFFKLLFLYPADILFMYLSKFKEKTIIKKLNNILKEKTVMFRGGSNALYKILENPKLKNRNNILGIIDMNPNNIGKTKLGYNIYNYSILEKIKPDILILSTVNIYNFDKIVQNELKNLNFDIPINKNIFNIKSDN